LARSPICRSSSRLGFQAGFLPALPTAHQQPSKARAGQRGGRQARDQAKEDCAPQVGVKLRGRQHRSRVRWQHAMHNRETGQERHSHQNRRAVGSFGGGGHNRQHQHQANLKKHRHSHQNAQRQQSPRQPLGPAILNQKAAQRGCSAAGGQQASQHRAKAQHNGDVPHQVAHAASEGERNLLERHSRGHAESKS